MQGLTRFDLMRAQAGPLLESRRDRAGPAHLLDRGLHAAPTRTPTARQGQSGKKNRGKVESHDHPTPPTASGEARKQGHKLDGLKDAFTVGSLAILFVGLDQDQLLQVTNPNRGNQPATRLELGL